MGARRRLVIDADLYKGRMDDFDHLDIVGWTLFWDSLTWYKSRVDDLRAL